MVADNPTSCEDVSDCTPSSHCSINTQASGKIDGSIASLNVKGNIIRRIRYMWEENLTLQKEYYYWILSGWQITFKSSL